MRPSRLLKIMLRERGKMPRSVSGPNTSKHHQDIILEFEYFTKAKSLLKSAQYGNSSFVFCKCISIMHDLIMND